MNAMAVLEPVLAITDKSTLAVRAGRPEVGTLMITHYQRLLDYLEPQFVHLLINGHLVASGGIERPVQLERERFAPWLETVS